ncbi:YebC/PmpR family DNA-binding regulatory protein [Spizellomyces punctatus DAOM BR117]|uniref:YebC/PmpR family DNA-binding regulatory protein n=1 Tax=Spizellomyces punctatus (strain DAOM BR117) TaxID=645134 RepID=A0A0L0H9L8_SPIPD|nr:YebC/PmpR family DNA-binding regulatory protein [Spizellomyces punctatus DAOM BR117]KNC97711.1 YebC/PmpR family DNA-binding regulatory protein [Spizellomyces punctatus DAOM BR117]|eukprot:XP_016605751.1 YebC/PmpR family DNA-binding regulatory protein [Spizellomyces punctatus DAOM BR117]
MSFFRVPRWSGQRWGALISNQRLSGSKCPCAPSSHPCPPSTSHSQVRHAGHNKWSKIKRAKGANDLQRANQTSKITRQIISAVKAGGGETDPSHNLYLASALQLARSHQLPKATLENALKKASGATAGGAEELYSTVYEGLGPAGVACIVEALTDNRNRTFAEVRHAFTKRGGSMTPVAYLFTKTGRIVFSAGTSGHSISQMEDCAIECEVEDIVEADEAEGTLEVHCAVKDLLAVKKGLEAKGYEIKEFETAYVSEEKVAVSDAESKNFESLLEQLDGMEDVVKVHHNAT